LSVHKTAILAGKDSEFLFAGENVFLDFDGFNVNAEASQQKQFALNETLVLPEKCALKNTPIGEFGMASHLNGKYRNFSSLTSGERSDAALCSAVDHFSSPAIQMRYGN